MTSIAVRVPGISCDHCKHAIETAVAAVPGVARVEVAVPSRTVHVDYDESAVSVAVLRAAIEDEGYDVP
jgi:copper chaperone